MAVRFLLKSWCGPWRLQIALALGLFALHGTGEAAELKQAPGGQCLLATDENGWIALSSEPCSRAHFHLSVGAADGLSGGKRTRVFVDNNNCLTNDPGIGSGLALTDCTANPIWWEIIQNDITTNFLILKNGSRCLARGANRTLLEAPCDQSDSQQWFY